MASVGLTPHNSVSVDEGLKREADCRPRLLPHVSASLWLIVVFPCRKLEQKSFCNEHILIFFSPMCSNFRIQNSAIYSILNDASFKI